MEDIKTIVAGFLKTNPSEIGAGTLIDQKQMKSSILLHRMYSDLSAAGFKVADYTSIRTFGELMGRISGEVSPIASPLVFAAPVAAAGETSGGLGIDIESISQLPETTDYRAHEFYANNFTAREISYCLLKNDPRQSFAGLFTAKEAIKKASATYVDYPLGKIELTHADSGQPVFPGFQISISHSDGLAVAVAVASGNVQEKRTQPSVPANQSTAPKSRGLALVISLLALLISVIAFFIAMD